MKGYPEHHPWLKMFTILAIPAGALFALMACAAFNDPYGDPSSPLTGLGLLVLGGGAIVASIYTLRVTDYFRRWNSGVPQRDKAIASLAIYMGVNMAIALILFIPFMRFITDAVGGGLGVSHRD